MAARREISFTVRNENTGLLVMRIQFNHLYGAAGL
jgi:hypothetical protein